MSDPTLPPGRLPKAEIRPYRGVPTLFINGQPNAGMTYMTYQPAGRHYASFGAAGVDLASLSVTADFSVFFGQPTAWLGPGRYDFSDMDEKMEMILAAHPGAWVFPRVYLCSPPWWDDQHPDQLVKWDDGSTERALARKNRFPSWASEAYRQATAENLRRFIEHVRRQAYGSRVIGYHIASGMWEEWFYWSSTGSSDGQSDLGDYSEPMAQAFRRWLERKYGTDALLQAAWNNSAATLAAAPLPGKAERRAADLFVWRDPARRANVIDFYEFYCENVTEIIRLLARTAKQATRGEQLVGVFYGYLFFAYADNWMQDNGHLALRKLLDCPDVDFLTAPSAYAYRQMEIGYSMGQSPTDAVRLHGKYYMNENDYRTHLVADQEEYRRIRTFEESEAVQLREMANMITRGWGGWWFDMSGGWYDEPRFMEMIAKLNDIAERSVHVDRSPAAEVAVVVDERSIFYTDPRKTLMLPLLYNQTLPLGRMGAPYDWVFLDDLDKAPAYKFYIFVNAFRVDECQGKSIGRLAGRGARALLWLYGAGFAGERSLDVAGCTAVTGIRIERADQAGPLFVRVTEEGAARLRSVSAGLTYGSKNAIGPLLYASDPEATVLGTLQGEGLPGLVLKNTGGIEVYYSAAPTLPASLLRGMAARAGVHIYNERDDVLYANRSFLSLYVVEAGLRRLRLPVRTDVYDVYRGVTVANDAEAFSVDLPAKHTVLYFLGSQAEWRAAAP